MAGDDTFDVVVNAPVSAWPARARATPFGSFRLATADNAEIVAPLTMFLDGSNDGDWTAATGAQTAAVTIVDEAAPHRRSGPVSDTIPWATPAR